MFKLFLRLADRSAPPTSTRPKAQAVAGPRPARRPNPRPLDPPPLPEVVAEGNSPSDWSAWEDSMTALDSQMQGLMPSARVLVRETRPSQLDERDPFSSVKRKND